MARPAKQGDTLFVIEPAPYEARLQQAQASLAATQAQFTQSEAEFKRQSSLGMNDFSSQSAVDQARADAGHQPGEPHQPTGGGDPGGDQPRVYEGYRAVRRPGHRASGVGRAVWWG